MKKKYVLSDFFVYMFCQKMEQQALRIIILDLYEMISIDLIRVSVHTFWNNLEKVFCNFRK